MAEQKEATKYQPKRILITVSEPLWSALMEFSENYQNYTEAARALIAEGLRERGFPRAKAAP